MSRAMKVVDSFRVKVGKVDVNDLLDAFAIKGGLDLNMVKKETPVGLERRDANWSFWHQDGRAFEGATYWVEEEGKMRQYLSLEAGMSRINTFNAQSVMEFALQRNRSFPSIFKVCLADDVLVLAVKCPVDGLSEKYLNDVINSFDSFGATLYAEIHQHFGLPSLLDSFRAEDERSRLN